ncbi:MAG: GTPase [Actinomycetota bacterium]
MIGRRRSQRDLPDALAALRAAIGDAEGRLGEPDVAMAEAVVAKADERLRHGTAHTLIALLGATGSGKSSLANAVVGSDVATTGIRRPTTSSTLACYWGDDDPQPLLEWLEVANRHRVVDSDDTLDGLVLLDVPDHDSIEASNREEMERIAEHADVLVWVTDHEKYGDAALHSYLRQLSQHGAVTVMVLNKADQLSAEDLATCRADLGRLLTADGLPDTPIVATSATAGADGVVDLRAALADAVAAQRSMVARLDADVRTAAEALLADLGADQGGDDVPRGVGDRLADELTEAAGIEVVIDAVAAGHRRDAARRTGWPFTRWIRTLRPHPLRRLHLGGDRAGRASLPAPSGAQLARTEGAVQAAIRSVTEPLPEPWPELVRDAATPDGAVLADRIDQAVAGSVRDVDGRAPRWWNPVNMMQIMFAAAVVAGLIWLAVIFGVAYFQLPPLPLPRYRGIPYPTGLVIGGIIAGLLLAFIARQFARVGARRRAGRVRKRTADAVGEIADEIVIDPMRAELAHRRQLRDQLSLAAGH